VSALVEFVIERVADLPLPEHYAPFEREWEWCPAVAPSGVYPPQGVPACDCDFATRRLRHIREVTSLQLLVREISRLEDVIEREFGSGGGGQADLDHSRALRLLALRWADHPDYRDEWSPEAAPERLSS